MLLISNRHDVPPVFKCLMLCSWVVCSNAVSSYAWTLSNKIKLDSKSCEKAQAGVTTCHLNRQICAFLRLNIKFREMLICNPLYAHYNQSRVFELAVELWDERWNRALYANPPAVSINQWAEDVWSIFNKVSNICFNNLHWLMVKISVTVFVVCLLHMTWKHSREKRD